MHINNEIPLHGLGISCNSSVSFFSEGLRIKCTIQHPSTTHPRSVLIIYFTIDLNNYYYTLSMITNKRFPILYTTILYILSLSLHYSIQYILNTLYCTPTLPQPSLPDGQSRSGGVGFVGVVMGVANSILGVACMCTINYWRVCFCP